MQRCEYLPTCGFLATYGESLALVCRDVRAVYCEGQCPVECQRLHELRRGVLPDDDMMPNGSMMPHALRVHGVIMRMPGNL